ncbi:MAG: thioredoxin domain-containing protein [Candidatus Flexifilum sp.]
MRRLLPVLFIVLSLIPAAAFAQTEADEGEPAPSIGLLGLIGFSPADFGLSAADSLPPALQALRDAAAEEVALLASLPQSRTPDGGFVLGDPDAPITIIEFADWACPHCQDYHTTISALIADQVAAGRAAFEFRILPTAGRDLVRLVNTAQTYREGRTLFKRLRTHLLLTGGVPELNASGIIGAAADRRIPVLSLPHSGIPTEPNLTYFGDAAIAWTEDYRAVWKDAIEPEAIHVVGLDPAIIARGYPLRSDAARPERARKRVTVLTSTVQLSALSYVEIDAHRRMLAALAHVPAHLRDRVEVCFKLHPVYDYRYFYESLVKDDSPVQIIRDRSIESVLDETDLALLVNINTSAHLLALARAIPLLHIHNAASWFRAYDRLDDWGQDFTIRDADAVWPAIERALFDPAYRRAVVDANRAYWNRLKADQPDPAERIAAILSDRLS